MNKIESEQYNKICEANLIFYKQTADQYESTETCLVDKKVQAGLQKDLENIVGFLRQNKTKDVYTVLDACGGSGNVATKLVRMKNLNVTLCDQSQELINIFLKKIAGQNVICQVVNTEISTHLSLAPQKYDLIVFSSALHHLENYEAVLKLAADCLADHGFIFTAFDPIQWKGPARLIMRLDYLTFKLLHHSKDVIPAVRRKIGQCLTKFSKRLPAKDQVNWGEIAEYHVDKGINDFELVRAMEQKLLTTVWHRRETKARYFIFELLLKCCGCKTNFTLLLQKKPC
ncbi:MAG: class I SAM-dependent methyltransferase [Candidatus Omnitrophica bacterium]|nr:class I SAM-dependent methyltransferase [Candidatus Omnitrophota bacterium]